MLIINKITNFVLMVVDFVLMVISYKPIDEFLLKLENLDNLPVVVQMYKSRTLIIYDDGPNQKFTKEEIEKEIECKIDEWLEENKDL